LTFDIDTLYYLFSQINDHFFIVVNQFIIAGFYLLEHHTFLSNYTVIIVAWRVNHCKPLTHKIERIWRDQCEIPKIYNRFKN